MLNKSEKKVALISILMIVAIVLIGPFKILRKGILGNVVHGNSVSEMFIIIGIIALGGVFIGKTLKNIEVGNKIKKYSFNLLLLIVLVWTYMFNSFDMANLMFDQFQADSESLVAGSIIAKHNNIEMQDYGLGFYINSVGKVINYSQFLNPDSMLISDDNFANGYSKTDATIVLPITLYSEKVCNIGNYIRFSNGQEIEIVNVIKDVNNVFLQLGIDKILTQEEYGSIADVCFLNSNKEMYPVGEIETYNSSYGLQGRIFTYLSKYMNYDTVIQNFHILCSFITALTFLFIVNLIRKKYNNLMAICFYIVFWLSPWIVNFARNLYWIEFSWFLPMLIGLYCSINIDNKKARIGCYIAVFIVMLFKCLCGYEYLSTIMMGTILFLVADLLDNILKKKSCFLTIKTIIMIGCMCLFGFFAAICIHGMIRGNGNLIAGIGDIWKQDVLRRTMGGNPEDFDPVYLESLQASNWVVLCKYFSFYTEIINGVTGKLFPVLCIVPIVIFVYQYFAQKIEWNVVGLYCFSFLASISWFVLAKSHSYIHTHINYVVWYFGYIQVCLYAIVKCFNQKKV